MPGSVMCSAPRKSLFRLKLGHSQQPSSLPVTAGAGVSLGRLGCSEACPWSLACSEVTSSCVETTSAKHHGNELGRHPHWARGLGECQAETQAARSAAQETQGEERGCGPPSGPSLSCLRQWTAAIGHGLVKYARWPRSREICRGWRQGMGQS